MKIYVLLALTCVSMFAESALKGTVTDSSGGPVAGAAVFVRWDSSGSTVGLKSNVGIRQDVAVRTGNDGDFSVSLPPGFYDVFVSARAYTPVCRKVRMRERSDVTFDPILQVDGLVIDELGTTFEAK